MSLSYAVSIGALVLIGSCIVSLFIYLIMKLKKLKSKSVKRRVGSIYSGYVVRRDTKYSVATILCSIFRRILISLVITFGKSSPLI